MHSKRDREYLRRLLENAGIWHHFYEFSEHTMTVEAAAKQLGISPEKIIKTLVVINERNQPLIAIVPGNKRLDLNKLRLLTGSKVRMAKAREVEEITGYPVGAIPPVGHEITTYVDRNILKHEKVVGGGGDTHTLVELKTEDLTRLTKAVISDIAEQ
ncbi:MAG: aminoacyl-tRNA deacylase [Thermoprotei archaeon]